MNSCALSARGGQSRPCARRGAQRRPHGHTRPFTTGFTLVEVMMASTLLLVGFVGLISAIGISANSMAHARQQTLATQILTHEIDRVRFIIDNKPTTWEAISAATAGSVTLNIDSQFDWAKDSSGDTYYGARYTLTRHFTNPNPAADLREVNFTVTWTMKSTSYSRRYSTYLGKNGLYLSHQRS